MANDLYNHLVIGNTATYQPRDMTKKKKTDDANIVVETLKNNKIPI